VLDILTWTEDEMRERLHLNTRAKWMRTQWFDQLILSFRA
jgi:hypothetical protein